MSVNGGELLARFLIGGFTVSFFAVVSEMLRPKTFAGLFGAAPSVALATLGITIATHGESYAAAEARSMLFGAIAFCCYAISVSWTLRRYMPSALAATTALLPIWFVVSIVLWKVMR